MWTSWTAWTNRQNRLRLPVHDVHKVHIVHIVVFAALLATLGAAQTGTLDQLAASVDDEVITLSDLRWIAEYRNLKVPEDEAGRKKFYLTLLDQLIEQKIIAMEAAQTPIIEVTAEEVENQIKAYQSQFPNPEAFRQKLRQMEISEPEFRQMIRRQLSVNEFVESRFKPFIIVLPTEIEEYYRQTLLPQLQGSSQPVPPLETVEESIRQILTEDKTNQELDRWLRSARRKSRIINLLFRENPYAPNLPEALGKGRELRTITGDPERK